MSDDSGKTKASNLQVTLAPELDEALDRAAAAEFTTRPEITRRALVEYLRQRGFVKPAVVAEVA